MGNQHIARTCWGKLDLAWSAPFSLCEEEGEHAPERPGVYLLAAFSLATPLLNVFYAGQSGDLRRRIREHLLGDRSFARHVRDRISTYFLFARVSNGVMRTAAEAALIRHFRPVGNAVTPVALPVDVTLPSLWILPH
jgi:hypothetical protein